MSDLSAGRLRVGRVMIDSSTDAKVEQNCHVNKSISRKIYGEAWFWSPSMIKYMYRSPSSFPWKPFLELAYGSWIESTESMSHQSFQGSVSCFISQGPEDDTWKILVSLLSRLDGKRHVPSCDALNVPAWDSRSALDPFPECLRMFSTAQLGWPLILVYLSISWYLLVRSGAALQLPIVSNHQSYITITTTSGTAPVVPDVTEAAST